MIMKEENYTIKGRKITLKSASIDEAEMLIEYMKTITGETRFLISEPDEINFTIEDEKAFINSHNSDDNALLMMAYVDDEYAGNCSFESHNKSKTRHRAEIGIALYQKYTGFGLGRLMLERTIDIMKTCDIERAELTVYSNNERAYNLYKSLGFKECGRIPEATKYKDGTYCDHILMTMKLK